MEVFFPKRPFFERLEFISRLSKQGQIADKVHLVVQYPLIKQGEILGKAFGSKKTSERLLAVAAVPEPLWTLSSEKPNQGEAEVCSNRVLLGTVSQQVWTTQYDEHITSMVGDLRFLDLTVNRRLAPSETHNRHLTFFLSGPRELWSVNQIREVSFTGEAKTKVINSKIELDEDFPFEIEVLPYYFHDEGPDPDKHELTANVLALHFKTAKSRKELPDDGFAELATRLARDLCVLVSLLSRSWVTWYRYQLVTNDHIKDYVREARKCTREKLGWQGTLIGPHRSRDFLRTGLSNYRKLRVKGLDLFTPILYFVSANEKDYIEEQFTTFFLSLEKIKDMFARQEGLLENVSEEDFKKLKSAVSAVIKENVESSKSRNIIKRKIRELNRPPLLYVLESLFSRYNVDWKDVYPKGSDLTLVKTRNDLFHSSQELDMDLLVRERDRLQALVERILLRMLGWNDISRSPTHSLKQWLTVPMESEPKTKKKKS